MEAVRRASPDRIVLTHEAERGYVPPRHRGVLVARDNGARDGCADDDMLILQADADTLYEPGYVSEMVHAARGAPGAMIEGFAHTSDEFIAAHPGYYRLADSADRAVDQFTVAEADEVIIDDKVAGYRLSDYLTWGGTVASTTVRATRSTRKRRGSTYEARCRARIAFAPPAP